MLGVVLNRPSETRVDEVMPRLDRRGARAVGHVLRRARRARLGWVGLTGSGSVDLSGEHRRRQLARPDRSLRLFAGSAGWGAEQLDDEIAEGSWWVFELSRIDDVLATDPSGLWSAVLRRQAGRTAWFAIATATPVQLSSGRPSPRCGRREGWPVGGRLDVSLEEAAVAEVEIGMGKAARRAYGLDDIAIVPSRRTRDAAASTCRWEIDAFTFDLPFLVARHGRRGQPGHRGRDRPHRRRRGRSHLEGIWTRWHETRSRCSTRSPSSPTTKAALPPAPSSTPSRSSPSSCASGSRELRAAGVVVGRRGDAAARRGPRRRHRRRRARPAACIQGTVVSAEHVTGEHDEPAQPQDLRAPLDVPGDRRRVRQLPVGAAPHAHRRGRRAGRVGAGHVRRRQPAGARHRRAPGHRHRRCPRRPHAPPRRDRRVRARHRRRAAWRPAATSPRRSSAAPTRCMLGPPLAAATEAPGRRRHWGRAPAHPTLPRGVGSTRRHGRHARGDPRRPGRRRPTARPTCSARCAARWP